MKTSDLERAHALHSTALSMMHRELHPEELFSSSVGNLLQLDTADRIRELIASDARHQKTEAVAELAAMGIEFDTKDKAFS